MRVTNTATYRNYTSSINNVHANLNKSLNKISSGRQYESAAESPLSYYRGMEIDSQHQEILSKATLLTDVKSRLEQQEKGIYDIQQLLKGAKNDVVLKARTATTDATARETLKADLLQKSQTMVNDLRSQYQDYYVYGGNDVSTPPFSLSSDGMTLTFSHRFPGESDITDFVMKLKPDAADSTKYKFELDTAPSTTPGHTTGTIDKLVQAMSEQGYMDLGYGDIRSRDTLLDTFTGGMNVLTGMNSDTIKSLYPLDPTGAITGPNAATAEETIMKALTDGPLGTVVQSVAALENFHQDGDGDALDDQLERLISEMTVAEHTVSNFYSDLGTKYHTLENTEDRLNTTMDSLKVQYKDIVGADPYESIYEMYNNQYAFNAALQVGSNLMQSSLFDFVR